jgi:glycosyltransferase involved in cell wall biosynthesis
MVKPRASVIIPAYNMAAYVGAAVDSVLGQDDIGAQVEVIVVDDGSTDGTAELLARYGDSIHVIWQENGGQEAAVTRGLEASRGEYIALLDADDVWRPDRLIRHVEFLESRPAIGLSYADMEVIDSAGNVIEPSYFQTRRIQPGEGRILNRVIVQNFIGTSGITFRRSLLPAVFPIPAEAAYTDWGVVMCIAAVAEVGLVPGIGYGYRLHENNRLFGGSGPDLAVRNETRNLPWYRWMMANVIRDPAIGAPDLRRLYVRFADALRIAASGHPQGAGGVLMPAPDRAEQAAADAPPVGPGAPRSRALLRALSFDPFNAAIDGDVQAALAAECLFAPETPPPLISTLQTRTTVTLARLDDLLSHHEALRDYARAQVDRGDETLVILAPPDADLSRLLSVMEGEPLVQDERFDAVLIPEPVTTPARAWLEGRAAGWLSGVSAEGNSSARLDSAAR